MPRRTVAAADVEGAVGPEVEVADGVARVLLAPVRDQRRRRRRHHVSGQGQPREASADDASVTEGARPGRWAGTRVTQHAGRPPLLGLATRQGVAGVEDIQVGVRRKLGINGQPEQAPIPEVVDLVAEVGDLGGGGVPEPVEDLDQSALLGHEHPAVRSEGDNGRVAETREGDGLLEVVVRQGARLRGLRAGQDRDPRKEQGERVPAHATGILPPSQGKRNRRASRTPGHRKSVQSLRPGRESVQSLYPL